MELSLIKLIRKISNYFTVALIKLHNKLIKQLLFIVAFIKHCLNLLGFLSTCDYLITKFKTRLLLLV